MEEALSFFRAFEVWIYLLLGLGGLIYVRKFGLAWQELREAGFGLEREAAQSRLNHSASVLVLLITMTVTEFILATFIAPAVPGATPLLTPTLDLLATPSITLQASTQPASAPPVTTPLLEGEVFEGTAFPTGFVFAGEGCLPQQIELAAPGPGQEISGIVEVMGTADIPNFGFYKIEMKNPDPEADNWLTIQAGNTVVQNGKLGDWDTSRLNPGEYQLGLVVVDNQAQASPPCVIQVRVLKAPEETLSP